MHQWSRYPDPRDPTKHVEIDDRYLKEWLAYGFAEITKFLGNHAAFDRWLRDHPQPESEQP